MLCYDAAYIAKPFKSSLLMDRCIHCNFLFMGEIQLDENFNVVIHFNAYFKFFSLVFMRISLRSHYAHIL